MYLLYTMQLYPATCYAYCHIKPGLPSLHKAAVHSHILLIIPREARSTCFTQSSCSQAHVPHTAKLSQQYLHYTKQMYPTTFYTYCHIKPAVAALYKAAVPNHMLLILPHSASCTCITQSSFSQPHVTHNATLSQA